MHKPLTDPEMATLTREHVEPFDEWLGLHKLIIAPSDRNDFSTTFRNAYGVTLEPIQDGLSISEETSLRLERAAAETGHRRRSVSALLGAVAAVCAIREEKRQQGLEISRLQ